MRLVGTAGHVDHGKSTLVHALTGINPDRLREEREREMTIELGFAWLTLPHGETISLVDVPGHEAFIKNMLAGAGGMDAALLVVAADEGIMPQTREHLAILDLLQLQGGVIALTKTDLPLDPEWLDLVRDETRATVRDTVLRDAEIVPVSARTGRGLDELQLALERVLGHVREKPDRARPRLPIDRVFTMSGFGTVVTGALSDGRFAVGDEVEIAPRGLRGRVRGLQAHKEKIETALPGGRVAMNLAGIATQDLARGDVVIHPGTYVPTQLLDVQIQWLASAPKPLAHSQQVELFLYSSQVLARVRLLESDTLAPGARGWAQLVLARPLAAAPGDRFILRYPSPSITVGGGIVVAANPTARHKRRAPEVLERLARAARGTPAERVVQFVEMNPGLDTRAIAQEVGLDAPAAQTVLDQAVGSGELMMLGEPPNALYVAQGTWTRWRDRVTRELAAYHAQFPLRSGMPREEFKSRLNLAPRVFELAMARGAADGILHVTEKWIALPTHHPTFDAATQERADALLEQFARSPYNPPSVNDAQALVGAQVLNALIEQERLVRIAPNVLLAPDAVAAMQAWVVEQLQRNGQITAAEVRDRFDTSRKYAIAFLEYLDARHITRRVGDVRVLR